MHCHRHTKEAIDEHIRKVLEKFPDIHLALLFGSLASGRPRPDSDVDIAVEAGQPLGIQEKASLISALAEALGRPVDLIDLSVAGEPLLGQILATGRRLIGDDARYARLLVRHLFEQADFMPYRSRILRERRREWIGM